MFRYEVTGAGISSLEIHGPNGWQQTGLDRGSDRGSRVQILNWKNLDLKYLKKRLEATNWAENKAYRFDVDSRDDPVISPDPFDSKNNHGSQLHNEKTNRWRNHVIIINPPMTWLMTNKITDCSSRDQILQPVFVKSKN